MDLWEHSGPGKWTRLAPTTTRTTDGYAFYDSKSNRLMILGVNDKDFNLVKQDWIYDPTTDRLIKKDAGDRPDVAGIVYDAESDRAIGFTTHFQTWAYDFDHDRWTQKAPITHPPARDWYGIAYDQGMDRVVLFGGEPDVGEPDLADTWTYDYNTDTWKQMSPAKSPPGRHYLAMAYDPVSRRTILFGGATGFQNLEKPLCDTWAYDLARNTWTQLSPGTSPSARGWHALGYDSVTRKIVLFGGGVDRDHFLNDTWLFDASANSWSRES
jgi:N-acetylneuraminic acid mutarotase